MGISVNFYNKKDSSESTSLTYSTMTSILKRTRLPFHQIEKEYFIDLPAKKVIRAFEIYLHNYSFLTVENKEYGFVKQFVNDYNDMRKKGQKPSKFGGA